VVLGFDSRRGLEIFLFTTASRTALGPTQPLIILVACAFSSGVKRPGGEADHSPPSSAEVKNAWSYTSIPQYVFMAWCLVKTGTTFTKRNYSDTACGVTRNVINLLKSPRSHIADIWRPAAISVRTLHVHLNESLIKVKFSMCLTKHHAMNTYYGSGGKAPHILNLGTRWR
jgi:hypothetical protein